MLVTSSSANFLRLSLVISLNCSHFALLLGADLWAPCGKAGYLLR